MLMDPGLHIIENSSKHEVGLVALIVHNAILWNISDESEKWFANKVFDSMAEVRTY